MKYITFTVLTLSVCISAFAEDQPSTLTTSKDQLPCIREACIGDPIDTICVSLDPILSLKDQLLLAVVHKPNSTLKSGRTTVEFVGGDKISEADFNKSAELALAQYRAGDLQAFVATVEALARKLRAQNEMYLTQNIQYLYSALVYTQKILPSASPQVQSAVAAYFIPQPNDPRRGHSGGDALGFDSRLNELLHDQSPIFCRLVPMVAQFKSTTGYPTYITAQPDTDGMLRIVEIRRVFNPPDQFAADDLAKRLAEQYNDFYLEDHDSLVTLGGAYLGSVWWRLIVSGSQADHNFVLLHPMHTAESNFQIESQNLARWTKGWLAAKNGNYQENLSALLAAQPGCTAKVPTE